MTEAMPTPRAAPSASAAASPRPRLDATDLAAYRRDGYLVLRGWFDAREVQQLCEWTDELCALPEVPGRHMVYYEDDRRTPGRRIVQRIENFTPFHGGFAALCDGERLCGTAGLLLGEPCVLFKDKINFKLPGAGGFERHQDQQAGWSVYAPLFITAFVGLDATTPENGCLEVAAGEHRRGMIGREWEPLGEQETRGMRFRSVPTEPGDVIFFDSYVPHGSGPNRTDEPRRVLYLTWNAARHGDHRTNYFADKRKSFPPDVEREPGRTYRFRV